MAISYSHNSCALHIADAVIENPICPQTDTIISSVTALLLIITALVSFFMILWAGLQYITSGGSVETMAKAKGRMTYAIIGLTVAFLAIAIMKVLGLILGFRIT